METPIILSRNLIRLAVSYLDSEQAFAWVGHGTGPEDNDDVRVAEDRAHMERYYPDIPFGLNVGNRKSDRSFDPLVDEDGDGFYELHVDWWPEGVYRFNYHGLPGEASSVGSVLLERRDGEVLWPRFYESWDEETRKAFLPFIYQERNGNGYCYRVLIRADRSIEPFGNIPS
ncbi:MAG: hypothetical protein HGA38_01475 [Candidatus Moranbacteria bacterium]|nr:hypothetical protein [Candidatus Moranbacteria bacterium]